MLNIQTADYEELKAAREEITTRIRDLEQRAVQELEQRARQFGFALTKGAPTPQRRKRRTRAEIEAGLTKPLDLTPRL